MARTIQEELAEFIKLRDDNQKLYASDGFVTPEEQLVLDIFSQRIAALQKVIDAGGDTTPTKKQQQSVVTQQVAGGQNAMAAAPPMVTTPGAPVVPLLGADEMLDEDVAAHIVDKQFAILKGWETALHVFDKTMTSESDKSASADFQGAVLKHFRDKLVGELIKRAKMAAEIKALADAIDGEIQRANKAQQSATLRDFVNQHAKAIGKLSQTTLSQRQGFISAVRKRREAAGVDLPTAGPTRPKKKKPVGKVEVDPKYIEEWTNMRMALMETLEAVDKTLADATDEKLLLVLTENWIRQGTVDKLAGQLIPAEIIIRLNPDLSVKNAHIKASGGQKLAEQLLKDSPGGVDLFSLKARRRILHYNEDNWPQATLVLDANNRDVTVPAEQSGKYTALKKHVFGKGLPPTKKITGD